jgi:hypothetical protein
MATKPRKIVQFIGGSRVNIKATPDNVALGAERWCANDPRTYMRLGFKPALKTWTRWFNVHSMRHIRERHPSAIPWYLRQDGFRPIYLLEVDDRIPGCVRFPGPELQEHFRISATEQETFFTHQAVWMMALAIYEQFERIDLCGYAFGRGGLAGRKYEFERPAMHYWIGRARQAGIEVNLPPEAQMCQADYLYGYGGPPL